jgi:hypothetical protein
MNENVKIENKIFPADKLMSMIYDFHDECKKGSE